MKTIHERIKEKREGLGLSMQELATASGAKAWQTVQQWENGTSAPSRKRLPRVAAALQTTAEYLMSGQDPELTQVATLQFTELNGLEAQLVMLYRTLSDDDKHELSVYANKLANRANPDKPGPGNPFPGLEKNKRSSVRKK